MPYDALTSAAEEMAPSRPTTNYFNPVAGQSILARYASTRQGAEDTAVAADAADKLRESQRRQTIWDRDVVDHQEQQNFKAKRGEFLTKLAELNHDDDNYEDKRDEILRTSPELATKDDAVRDMLTFKDRSFEAKRQSKEREAYQKGMLDARSSRYEQSALERAAASGIKPEEIEQFRTPEGELDIVGLAHAAGEKSRALKTDAAKQRMEMAQSFKLRPAASLSAQDKKERGIVTQHIEGDTMAFPSQLSSLMAKYGKTSESDLKDTDPQGYEAAKAYDKNKIAAEMESALNYDREEYVDLVPKLSEGQKEKRRRVWYAAKGEVSAPAAPTGAAPAVTKKTLTADVIADIKNRAGGDPLKAKQIALDEGY